MTMNKLYIVDFTTLPANLRTREIRKNYDLNTNGILESKTDNGQNEIHELEKAMRIDLSEYKIEVSKVATDVSSRTDRSWTPYQYTNVYNTQGKKVLSFESEGEDGFVDGEFCRVEINNNERTIKMYNENLEPEDGCIKKSENVTFNNVKGFKKTEYIKADGSSTIYYLKGSNSGEMPTPDFRQIRIEKNALGETVRYTDLTADEYGSPKVLEKWEK